MGYGERGGLGVAELVFSGEQGLATGGELAEFIAVAAGGRFVGVGSGDGFIEEVDEGGWDSGDDAFE